MLKNCKYLLFGLGLLFCVNFSSADFTGTYYCPGNCNFTFNIFDKVNVKKLTDVALSNDFGDMRFMVYFSSSVDGGGSRYQQDFSQPTFDTSLPCSQTVKSYCKQILQVIVYGCNGNSCTINSVYTPNSSCPECEECETCPTTGEVLSGACDINYCVENDLCPTSTGSRSELVINNIVHEGKPLINLNIPDYIYWDYTSDENQYDIYIGSGYDQDYIDSILAINSYRPDSKDFTQIFVSGLTLIFPYIFVALLIVFMWKLLKRIFK